MPALVDVVLDKLTLPIDGAKVEKYDKGVRLRIPIDVIVNKIKEELAKSMAGGRSPIPFGVIDIRVEGDTIVFDVRVV